MVAHKYRGGASCRFEGGGVSAVTEEEFLVRQFDFWPMQKATVKGRGVGVRQQAARPQRSEDGRPAARTPVGRSARAEVFA